MTVTWVMTVERKGSLWLGPFVDGSLDKLKAHAQELDGADPLTWQQYGGEFGAHSECDDERGYSIRLASALP